MKNLKKKIEEKLGIENINMGFEIIGDIAIIELLSFPINKQKLENIADTIKEYHPNINVVVRKIGDVEGIYRIASHELIKSWSRESILKQIPKKYSNLDIFETLHKEHGVRALLNINKTYFSSKLGFERKRIMEKVQEGEKIFLPFGGVGIYGLVIAKHKEVEIDMVEINPHACEYAKKNIALNNLKGTIKVYKGNVKEYIKEKTLKEYDRIIMPAPHDAPTYFEDIVSKAKIGTYIHYYFFEKKENITEPKIKEIFSRYGVNVLYFRKAGSIGTNTYRVVADLIKTKNNSKIF